MLENRKAKRFYGGNAGRSSVSFPYRKSSFSVFFTQALIMSTSTYHPRDHFWLDWINSLSCPGHYYINSVLIVCFKWGTLDRNIDAARLLPLWPVVVRARASICVRSCGLLCGPAGRTCSAGKAATSVAISMHGNREARDQPYLRCRRPCSAFFVQYFI